MPAGNPPDVSPTGATTAGKWTTPIALQPGKLVAVGARIPIDDERAGVDVRVLIVRNGGRRRDRAEERIVVAEELRPGGFELQPLLLDARKVAGALRDVACPAHGWRLVVGERVGGSRQEQLKLIVQRPARH
jgi:hypothetical protein